MFEKIPNILPINFNPNAPALYGQGLSDYEILVRICKQINICIDSINSFNDVIKILNDILKDFDDTLKKEILKILEQWYNDGTLKDIVSEIVEKEIEKQIKTTLPKILTLDFAHSFRTIQFTGKNWERFNPNATNYDDYSNCQGGCRFTIDGIEYYAEVLHNSTSGKVKIYKYNNAVTPYKTFNIDTTHAQAITFNPDNNCLYVTKFNDSGIYEFNVKTNAIRLNQISSDDTEGRWWSVKTVYENGKYNLYGFKNKGVVDGRNTVKLYLIDFENETSEYKDTVKLPDFSLDDNNEGYNTYINANCCLNDKYIVVLTNRPNSLVFFKRSTDTNNIDVYRKPEWVYAIPQILNKCYATGEIEDITIDNDLFIDLTTLNDLNGTTNPIIIEPLTTVIRHYKLNLAEGLYSNSINKQQQESPFDIYYNNTAKIYSFYVNWNNKFGNPAGTSGQPFRTIQEAIEVIRNCPEITNANITLLSTDNLPCFINCGKNISINLNDFTLYGLYTNLSTVHLRKGRIAQSCNKTEFDNNSPIYCFGHTRIGIFNVVSFTDYSEHERISCNNDMYAQYTEGIYTNFTNNAGTEIKINKYASFINAT